MLIASYSNGPVWAQLLAKTQALELHDHAIGGATADNSVVQGYTVCHTSHG
jgi:hypothetical protein